MEPVQTPGAAPPPGGIDPPKEGEQAPKYVTDEQLQSALADRFRAFEQKVDKTLSGLAPKLREELAALVPKPEPKPVASDGKEAPGKGTPESPELKRLQEQVTQLTKQAEDARSERDAERARARDTTLRQRLTEALSAAGIEGVRARHAVGLLVDAERRVRWSGDDDAIAFDDVDLASGLREWLKTDDAKLYLPARGVAGSGDRPGAQPPPRAPAGPPDRATVADGLRRVLLGQI